MTFTLQYDSFCIYDKVSQCSLVMFNTQVNIIGHVKMIAQLDCINHHYLVCSSQQQKTHDQIVFFPVVCLM